MLSQQELSGQQVALYLLDLDDHFTSHSFRNLHWLSFEGLVAMGSQLSDYVMRGEELSRVCVWDFVARVDRVSKAGDKRKHASANAEEENQDVEEDLMVSQAYKRPRVNLLPGHDQETTHLLKVRAPDDALVPVPIGPGLPRRDQPPSYAKYCRLMLILLKPWRKAEDLRTDGQSWEAAFDEWMITCSNSVKSKMDNMQILHECKDSRDDH
ncbi:hypothetical protein C8F01DRAFT_993760, partial [Mycena amicta]